ncbi:MAG: magnesium chelatase subunit D [Elioraea sp.]|nr:magnesium chelatase subunit D [Elioraea sp.]
MAEAGLPSPAADAAMAARLFALDPTGCGVLLRARPGPARDAWLALLRRLWPEDRPLRRVPVGIPDSRLLGGLDLAATLAAGRAVAERGVLAECDGGAIILAMAERLEPGTAARIARAIDEGEVVLERDGLARRLPARFGVVALDEGLAEEEVVPRALADRLAIHLALDETVLPMRLEETDLDAARALLPRLRADERAIAALVSAALALGIDTLRAPLHALAVARAAAALAGRGAPGADDIALAARLVLAPRATRLPAPPQAPQNEDAEEAPPPPEADAATENDPRPLEDLVLEAARAAIPPDLLAKLDPGLRLQRGVRSLGRFGTGQKSRRRGRPSGVRPGALRPGERLALVETIRAAAPWQRLRRAEGPFALAAPRVIVRREDIRLVRFRAPTERTAIFAVDASGSTALARLAEAKGAVEILLSDCYVRRDTVALIAFRGRSAEIVLPPTNALARARRALAGLPGGGGTPLAAALELVGTLAAQVARRGRTPIAVLLTDGRANVARDGTPGRPRAEADALAAARQLRAQGLAAILIDTAPRPQPSAQRIAAEMGARYLALPYADAARLSRAVRAEMEASP